ncbi:MAG: hypothetical protein U0Y68_13685 [Blastocatellia bacterium]
MSAAGLAVIVLLLLMSVYSLAVTFERYLTFKSAAKQSREFVPKVSEMLKTSHLSEALQLSREYKKSHLAVVVNSGLQELTASNIKNPLRKAKRALTRGGNENRRFAARPVKPGDCWFDRAVCRIVWHSRRHHQRLYENE